MVMRYQGNTYHGLLLSVLAVVLPVCSGGGWVLGICKGGDFAVSCACGASSDFRGKKKRANIDWSATRLLAIMSHSGGFPTIFDGGDKSSPIESRVNHVKIAG